MSAEQVFTAALTAAITRAIGTRLNGVFVGPAAKATPPYAEIGELLTSDWSTKDSEGRELRSLVILRDRSEWPERLHALADAVDRGVRAIDAAQGAWRIASLGLIRLRIVRDGTSGWAALIEHRARMLAEQPN